jgi:sarcosine oxidase subunit beta
MFSQRGVMNLAHTLQDVRDTERRVNANRLNGVDAEFLTPAQIKELEPTINLNSRYPVLGASIQRRGGVARHDAVAWGFARGADQAGVDIVQNCQVTGIRRNGNQVTGVDTTKGFIKAKKVAVVAAGNTSTLADMAGVRLPLESHPLQALVSEPIKPVVNTVVMSNAVHAYISQSDKGDLVIGAGVDQYTGFGQRGSFQIIEGTLEAIVDEPAVGRHRGRLAGRMPDHQQDRREGALFQLRLGHGRLQGDPRFRLGLCVHDRERRAA